MGEVIAVTSGKGGTGKTTVCAAVASCLAADGYRVLCIDADIGLRNLDISLGMQELAPISFADVLFGRYTLEHAAAHPEIPGLFLLTAPAIGNAEAIPPEAFAAMLDTVRTRFDYCFLDSPAGIGQGFRLSTAYADRIIVVAAPDPASVRDAASTADQLRLKGKDALFLAVNRVTPAIFRAMDWTVDDIMDETGLPLIGLVPEDDDVVLSAAAGKPLILCTDQGAALGCLHIARRLEGERVPLLRIR